jgi:hypothetical protein
MWIRSSYSQGDGGQCVEVATALADVVPVRDSKAPDRGALLFPVAGWSAFVRSLRTPTFTKSSYSGGDGGQCVEVALGLAGAVPVRDSKAPDRAVLSFPAAGWTSFVRSVRGGACPTP